MAATPHSVLIIEAPYYEDIARELARGAVQEIERRGAGYERVTVTGALEIPQALAIAIANGVVGPRGRHSGCVALGCVIRGETSHYEIVAGESARGLLDLSLRHAVPVGNGILTVDNREQAWARAGVDGRNKGGDAASACLALMGLRAGPLAGKE